MRTETYFRELGCVCLFALPSKRVVEVCTNGDLLITRKKAKGFWGKKIHRKISIATAIVEMIDEKVIQSQSLQRPSIHTPPSHPFLTCTLTHIHIYRLRTGLTLAPAVPLRTSLP